MTKLTSIAYPLKDIFRSGYDRMLLKENKEKLKFHFEQQRENINKSKKIQKDFMRLFNDYKPFIDNKKLSEYMDSISNGKLKKEL